MPTNNSINTQGLASSGEVIAGVVTNKLVTPFTLDALLDTFTIVSDLSPNLGLYYSSGTLSIKSSVGADLSSGAPGRLKLSSKASAAQYITYVITANQTLTTSDLTSNLFGTTTSVAWAEDKPFYLYAVPNDAETAVSFMISAVPHRSTSPAAANISKTGLTAASTQGSFFAFGNPTIADYESNGAFLMGSFRMRKDASNIWTVQALDNQDGLYVYQQNRLFNYPSGQQTAASGEWFRPNAGTPAVFTTNTYQYTLSFSGVCQAVIKFDGDGGTDGSGSVNVQLTAPYTASTAASQFNAEISFGGTTASSVLDFSGNAYAEVFRSDTGAKLTYAGWVAGARSLSGIVNYVISSS
jgi:hypothetical protein